MEWDEEQQATMLALAMVRQATCDGCGGHLPDTTAPEAEGAYVADAPLRCHCCTAIAIKAEQYRDAAQAHTLRFPSRRKPTRGGGL